jgi:hypothetical protein
MDQIRSDQIKYQISTHGTQHNVFTVDIDRVYWHDVYFGSLTGSRVLLLAMKSAITRGSPVRTCRTYACLQFFFCTSCQILYMCAGNAILMINSCTVYIYIYMCTSICMNARMHFSLLQVTNSLVLALYALGCAVKQYKIMITAENSRFHVLCILVQLPFMYMDSNYQIKFNWVTNHTH